MTNNQFPYWRIVIVFLFISIMHIKVYAQEEVVIDSKTFGAIEARQIGPARMSGRIACIDGVNKDDRIVYVGAASGGVWKTTNGGTTFKPVFDKYNQSIGTITIDQHHPDTVWVGTGEVWVRNSVSVGDGIYKSTDGGDTWTRVGLEKTERIARIRVHPQHPDTVFVAAMGQLWGPNEDRGVYRTRDGGKTWEKVLYVDVNTGAADISIDPRNPDILYASMWDYRRKAWTFRSGGPGSGFYRSTDGGSTWNKITQGLPTTTLGRIAIDISPVDPTIVYALVEAGEKKSALYRSHDRGLTWQEVNKTPTVSERPFYFSLIVADPVDTNRVYKPGLAFNFSKDMGKTFSSGMMSSLGGGVHSDLHALWISPLDNKLLYLGTDGGVYVSRDQGGTWNTIRNIPVSQFYHVSVDMAKPYNVYGGLQDNGSWFGPSASPGGINNHDWVNVNSGDGFYAFRDPLDPDIVYSQSQGGEVNRLYVSTQEAKTIRPYEDATTEKLRFNWNTPVVFGAKSGAMYIGAQYLYRSTDKGDTWIRISPDLTTDDPEKQKQNESGGVTVENTSAENHCTIITINESSLDEAVVWAGTDDGNLQVTRDGGKTWANVVKNVPDLPPNTWCSYVMPSRFNKATTYVTFDGHRGGDMKPYVYKTTDYGQSWTSLVDANLPIYCHVILQDLVNPSLLLLGTEFGLFVSINDGKNWSQFTGNFPNVPVMDMVIHPRENDLVLATHGRGIFIIDDITPLRSLTPDIINQDIAFLPSRPYYLRNVGSVQDFGGNDEFVGPNPQEAGLLTYYLKKRHVFGDMKIEVYGPDGKLINTLAAGKRKGINRVPLNVRLKAPKVPAGNSLSFAGLVGPPLPTGTYTVKILKDNQVEEGTFFILPDPDSRHTDADRQLQYATLMKSYHMLEDLAFVDKEVTDMKKGSENMLAEKLPKATKKLLEDLKKKTSDIHANLVNTSSEGMFSEEIKLREKISGIYGGVLSYLGRPTNSQIDNLTFLEKELMSYSDKVDSLMKVELVKVNQTLVKAGKKEITVTTREEFDKAEQK